MKKKNLLLTAALSLCAVCATAGVAGSNTAKAENGTTFEMAGASVRYQKNNDEQEGIRFRVKLDSVTYQNYLTKENAKIETGVLAIPAHELTESTLDINTANAKKAVTYDSDVPENNLWTEFVNDDGTTDEGYMQSLVYCWGIPEAYYNAPFLARGYVKITEGENAEPVYYYTDELRQSYLETAYRANQAEGNEALQAILNTNTYTITGEGKTLQTGHYGDALNLNDAESNDGWQFAGWSQDGKTEFSAKYIKGDATLSAFWNKVNGQENEAKVIAGITGEGKTAAAKYASEYSIAMDKDTANTIGELPLKSLTVAGEEVELASAKYENGTLTVSKPFGESDLKTFGNKAYTAVFGEGDNALTVVGELLFVTYEINSQAELDAMVYVTDGAADGENTYGGYITLGKDIAYEGTYTHCVIDGNNNYAFGGTFDGRGHNIDGFTVNYGGLLGNLQKDNKVKNVSFTNAVNVDTGISGLLACKASEHAYDFENIYVHFKTLYGSNGQYNNGALIAGAGWGGSAATNGKAKNVFVCADSVIENKGVSLFGQFKTENLNTNLSGVYFYGNDKVQIAYNVTNKTGNGWGVYADKAAIKAANIDFAAFNADSFWQLDFDGLPYPDSMELKRQSERVSENKVITEISGEGAAATVAGTAQSFTIDISDVKDSVGGVLTSLTVGANTYTDGISYEGGIITVNHALTLADYGYQNYTAVFAEHGKELKVAGRTLFITLEITNKAELDSMQYVTDGVVDGEKTYGGYIVLGANIAYNGTYIAPGYTFSGTFDGRGYNIDRLSTGNVNGIFGVLDEGVIIKNLSFTNAANHNDWTTGFIAKSAKTYATNFEMKNFYIHFKKFTTCWRENYCAVLILQDPWGNANALRNGKISNIIVAADEYSKNTGAASIVGYYSKERTANITDVYAYGFGDGTYMTYYKDNDYTTAHRTGNGYGVYSTKAELIAANVNYSAFAADSFWQVDSEGVPVSKSAAALNA